uniref:Si:dkey-13a21.4 n=1 Tax=Oryzias latipes TaxID=8090 RepID=A0A3P9JFX5_ORYLA
MSEKTVPLTLKIILIGNSGVGKSSFMNRYVNHRFTNAYRATVGTDFFSKKNVLDGEPVILQVSSRKAQQWCEEVGAEYFEGSAKADVDVEPPFNRAAKLALQQYKKHTLENTGHFQITCEQPRKTRDTCMC